MADNRKEHERAELHRTIWGMLFYFAPTEECPDPPFNLNGFRYEQINDSAEIQTKVKPLIESILNGVD